MPLTGLAGYMRSYIEVKPHLAKPFVEIYLDLENYLYFSGTALVIYDYFLTLDREVSYVWRAKQSFATLLFYGFRYSALLNLIPMLLVRMSWPSLQNDWSCGIMLHVQMALDIVILVCSTVFAALRVYAMFDRGRLLFLLVLLSGLLNPGMSIYIFKRSLTTLDAYESIGACMLTIIGDERSYENWMIAARAASVVSDGIVLALTIRKTFRNSHQAQRVDGLPSTLTEILLRDTVLCFSLLCVVNVVGIATGRLTEFIEIWQTWTATFTSILLSRLTLDIRETSDSKKNDDHESYSRTLRSNLASDPSTVFTETDLDMVAATCSYSA